MALFAVVLIWLALVLSWEIRRPWIDGVDFNGAVWSQAAHNILRAGLTETAGASSGFYFGPLPIPAWGYYLHHPPLLHLAITGLFAVLGEHEWVARLVPVGCSLVSAIFLWLLVRSCGPRTATLSAAFASFPMQLRYGAMVNFEPCVLMLMLGALLCLRWHHVSGATKWKYAALAFIIVGLWVDWAMYLFVIALCVCWLLRSKGGDRRFAGIIFLSTLVSGALYLLRIKLLRPDAWQSLSDAFMVRIGTGKGGYFTEAQWLTRMTETLVDHFLPLSLVLGAIGAAVLWRARSHEKAFSGWTRLPHRLRDGAPLRGLFQNVSYIHPYSAFYLWSRSPLAPGWRWIAWSSHCKAPGLRACFEARRTLGLLILAGIAPLGLAADAGPRRTIPDFGLPRQRAAQLDPGAGRGNPSKLFRRHQHPVQFSPGLRPPTGLLREAGHSQQPLRISVLGSVHQRPRETHRRRRLGFIEPRVAEHSREVARLRHETIPDRRRSHVLSLDARRARPNHGRQRGRACAPGRRCAGP